MIMELIDWIGLGMVVGYFACMRASKRGKGLPMDIILGIVGAVAGGLLFKTYREFGSQGFSGWGLLVALAGAVFFLWIWHGIRPPVKHA